MNIVIDTNILISSLLKNGKRFRDIIFNPDYQVYAPNFLVVEIFKHKDKIVKYSGMNETDLLNQLHLILKNINFVNENCILLEFKQKGYDLCKDIDIKDSIFVSMAFYLNAKLLSGDKVLKNGLLNKQIDIFFDY